MTGKTFSSTSIRDQEQAKKIVQVASSKLSIAGLTIPYEYFNVQGITGCKVEKAPFLNLSRCLLLLQVPSGKIATGGNSPFSCTAFYRLVTLSKV